VFTQRGKLGCAYEHGRRFASLQNNDCIGAMRIEFPARQCGNSPRSIIEYMVAAHTRRIAAASFTVNNSFRSLAVPSPAGI
jgi:hypothetical protein